MSDSIHRTIEILPSPGEIKQELPLHREQATFISHSRDTVRSILNGHDNRLLAIVGPCSIHHLDSAKEFARRLIKLQKEIGESFFLIMRVYSEKSRTKTGWKGLLNDPHLNGTEDISTGIQWTRNLLLELAELGIPTATEFLDPFCSRYYEDLITWGCIGARTSESQTHRQMASGLPMPIAFKNNTMGCIEVALNGLICACGEHRRICVGENGKICIANTPGNKDLHIALRGGKSAPNFEKNNVKTVLEALRKYQLPERLLIDCSHGNSPNNELGQEHVFRDVMKQILEGNRAIKGVILESHLRGGNQSFNQSPLHPETSITDACLDWDQTAELLQTAASELKKKSLTKCAI